ncbi:MAG: hypothetical protein HY016_00630 [Nitrosomonadales bacterium]|nr:hypothetical protein [Nitrosomonadales bacterium]
MPYFVYKIFETPIRRLEKLEQHDAFSAASNRAKQLRGELGGEATYTIKVIFADNELHAEDLLNQVRTAAPNPQDD